MTESGRHDNSHVPMNVLHVMPAIDPKVGGPIAMAGLAAAQRRAGMDVTMLAVTRPGNDLAVARQLESAGVKVTLVGPVGSRSDEARALGAGVLDDAVRAADVVHLHALWEEAQYRAARACRAIGRPYLVTPHGMLDSWSLRQRWLKKRVYRVLRLDRLLGGAAALHATSDAERREIEALRLGPPVIIEPLGIDMGEFEALPPRGTFRARHPQIGARPLVVFLGRIHPGKGVEYLIPALAQPGARDVILAAVGPDSKGYLAEMRKLAEAHGVADRVIFPGMAAGAERIPPLVDADLFALPSDHENFGVAAVEALAAGTPVLISDRVNIFAELRDAGVARIAERDPAAIAVAIGQWFGEAPERRAEVAARCRPFVRERYDWSSIARRWLGHYERLAAHGRRPNKVDPVA